MNVATYFCYSSNFIVHEDECGLSTFGAIFLCYITDLIYALVLVIFTFYERLTSVLVTVVTYQFERMIWMIYEHV